MINQQSPEAFDRTEIDARVVAEATATDIANHFSQGELFPDESVYGTCRRSLVERYVGKYILSTKDMLDWRYTVALKGAGYDTSQGVPEFHNLAWDEVNEIIADDIVADSPGVPVRVGWHILNREDLLTIFEFDFENLAGLTEGGFSFDRGVGVT